MFKKFLAVILLVTSIGFCQADDPDTVQELALSFGTDFESLIEDAETSVVVLDTAGSDLWTDSYNMEVRLLAVYSLMSTKEQEECDALLAEIYSLNDILYNISMNADTSLDSAATAYSNGATDYDDAPYAMDPDALYYSAGNSFVEALAELEGLASLIESASDVCYYAYEGLTSLEAIIATYE